VLLFYFWYNGLSLVKGVKLEFSKWQVENGFKPVNIRMDQLDLTIAGLYELRSQIERDPEYYSPWTVENVDQVAMRLIEAWDRS